MHMLMNFIHATAIIKAGSGMKEDLAGTLGSIDKMLNGMKWKVEKSEVISFTRLIDVLEVRASCSMTTKLWSDNGDHNHHVKTVMMNFSRGGYEGDWAL